jgi:hypothetical protein
VSEYRWEARPRVEQGTSQWDASGLPLQLVTIGLLATEEIAGERGEPVKRAPVLWDLRASEARELAFELLELAELADRRSEEMRR